MHISKLSTLNQYFIKKLNFDIFKMYFPFNTVTKKGVRKREIMKDSTFLVSIGPN